MLFGMLLEAFVLLKMIWSDSPVLRRPPSSLRASPSTMTNVVGALISALFFCVILSLFLSNLVSLVFGQSVFSRHYQPPKPSTTTEFPDCAMDANNDTIVSMHRPCAVDFGARTRGIVMTFEFVDNITTKGGESDRVCLNYTFLCTAEGHRCPPRMDFHSCFHGRVRYDPDIAPICKVSKRHVDRHCPEHAARQRRQVVLLAKPPLVGTADERATYVDGNLVDKRPNQGILQRLMSSLHRLPSNDLYRTSVVFDSHVNVYIDNGSADEFAIALHELYSLDDKSVHDASHPCELIASAVFLICVGMSIGPQAMWAIVWICLALYALFTQLVNGMRHELALAPVVAVEHPPASAVADAVAAASE